MPGKLCQPAGQLASHSVLLPAAQVVSSLQVEGDVGHVTIVASTRLPQRAGGGQRLRLRVPRIDAYFTGTGA